MNTSVIIITKNEENTIESVIQAVIIALKEYFKKNEYEIIVVDSNSTDQTGRLTNKALEIEKNLNYTYVKVESNYYSAALSREIGRKYACGKYILFLDGDMLLYKNFLKDVFQESVFNQDVCGVVGIRYDALYDKNKKIEKIKFIKRQNDHNFTYYPGGGVLLVAKDIENIHYLEKQKMNEEEFFSKEINISKNKRIKYIDKKMYLHLNYKKNNNKYKRRVVRAIESANSSFMGLSHIVKKYGIIQTYKYYNQYILCYLLMPLLLFIMMILAINLKNNIISGVALLTTIIYLYFNKLRSFTFLVFIKNIIIKDKTKIKWETSQTKNQKTK